jgi:hypothetical protein
MKDTPQRRNRIQELQGTVTQYRQYEYSPHNLIAIQEQYSFTLQGANCPLLLPGLFQTKQEAPADAL